MKTFEAKNMWWWQLACCLVIAGGGCREEGGETEPPAEPKAEAVAKDRADIWPNPLLLWKTAYKSAVRPVTVAGKTAIAASYRVKRHWAAPRGLAGFRLSDGKLRWKTPKRPKMMRRTAPWSLSYAKRCANDGCVLAYQRRRKRVRVVDAETGDPLWRLSSRHGVTRCASGFAVSEGEEITIVEPRSGQRVKRLDLTKPSAGARSNGTMTELYDPSVLLFDRGRFLIARDDGGEVQSLDGSTGKLAWRFSVEGELGERVLELPRSGGTLLVPAVFPEKTRAAEIAAWKRGTVDGEPLWRVTIEGLVRRKWIKQNSERLLLRATEKSDREYLVRLDRDSGEKLSRVQIPDIKHCVPGPADVYFCRSATSILALETPGGELVWESDLGSSRKRVHSVWWAGKWVAAESASKLYLLDAKSGEKVSSFPKKLDGARIDINDVLGPQGHQVYLVVKTFQESARLDRRYLVAIDGRTGKKVYEKRLGIPTSGRRDHRVRYDERDLGVPVIYLEPDGEKPARIFSAVGRLVRLINASDGEIVREFGMPGGKKRPTGLLSEDKGVALVERGKLLIAIDIEEARVLWRKHVPSQEVIHHHGREAFLEDIRGNLEWVSPAGSKPLPATLTKTMRSERPDLALANEGLFIARSGKKALFVDRETGKVENEIEGRWIFFYQGDLILGMRQLRRGGKPGVYVGLDIETGKTRWKRSVATEARSGTLPPTFSRERRWPVNWMAGAGGRFLITDSAGRCVTALDSGDGETVWTVCFSKLTGPPLSARGYLLVPARGPATMLAEGVAGPAGETSKKNGDRSALYAVRLRDGRVRRIFTGPEGKSLHLGTARPTSNGLLLATLSDPSSKMDELAALRLWREPRRIEKLGFAWPLSARAWQPLIPESMRGDRPDRKGR